MKISKIKTIFMGALLGLNVTLFSAWLIGEDMDKHLILLAIGLSTALILAILLHSAYEARKAVSMSPQWLTGADIVEQFNISYDMLIQYIRNGIPAYPHDTDIHFVGNEALPISTEDTDFLLSGNINDLRRLWFKRKDLKGIKRS
ncbi:MAG: hypothetical protein H8D67_21140 [Deltaproteobacteria bacterium]|nr:hypothetical protein [Deltaproteobacteria bacterium]